MKNIYSITLIFALILSFGNIKAGNEQRAGQAGASELLINPWTASSGWADAGMASIQGIEALFHNVAGTAFTKKTEIAFSKIYFLKSNIKARFIIFCLRTTLTPIEKTKY